MHIRHATPVSGPVVSSYRTRNGRPSRNVKPDTKRFVVEQLIGLGLPDPSEAEIVFLLLQDAQASTFAQYPEPSIQRNTSGLIYYSQPLGLSRSTPSVRRCRNDPYGVNVNGCRIHQEQNVTTS